MEAQRELDVEHLIVKQGDGRLEIKREPLYAKSNMILQLELGRVTTFMLHAPLVVTPHRRADENHRLFAMTRARKVM